VMCVSSLCFTLGGGEFNLGHGTIINDAPKGFP